MSNRESYHDYMIRRTREEREMKEGLGNHIIALKNKHHALDKIIETLIAEHAPDVYISERKREKLFLKDQIVEAERQLKEINNEPTSTNH